MEPPILTFSKFGNTASLFIIYTDGSRTGIGAVLEQDSLVIIYTCRVLIKSEKQYSVMQQL